MNIFTKTVHRIATLLRKRRSDNRHHATQLPWSGADSVWAGTGISGSLKPLASRMKTINPLRLSSRFGKKAATATACTIVSLMFGSMQAQAADATRPPALPGTVAIEGNQPTYSIGAPEQDFFSMNAGRPQQMFQERGMGYYFRVGTQGGRTVGTEESLSYIEALPYTFWEETMFLADLRLWAIHSGRMGGSVGAGFRHYFPQMDRTLGMIAWYDIDATYPEDFREVAVTLESHGCILDWDANIYIPIDLKKQDVGLDFVNGSQRFEGNNVLFDQLRTSGFALQGFDTMWGTPIGTEFAQRFDMRASTGFYNFNHEDLDDIWGWSGKLEANFLRYLDVDLTVTHDKTFDTRVAVNASWTFDPHGEIGERSRTWDRMVLPPTRLWTIPKAEVAVLEPDQVAINPTTGLPYFVVHVDSVTGVNAPGAGTFENPFNSINNAVNGGNAVPIDDYDIVYTWSGSQFDSEPTIVVPDGKRFLGGGDRVEHFIEYNEFGDQLLPRARGDYNDGVFDPRPLFTNLGAPAGPGVTFDLVTNLGGSVISNEFTEFSGFVLGNPDGTDPTSGDSDGFNPNTTVAPGNGPLGNGIDFATLTTTTQTRFVDIHGAEANGVEFSGLTGTYLLESMIINQSGNHEFFVQGGAPTITMQSSTRGETGSRVDSYVVNRANGSAIIPDTTAGTPGDNHDLLISATTGGSVDWIDVITNDLGGDGIMITGASQSDVTIPVSTTIVNSRGNGVGIFPGVGGDIIISGSRTDGNPSGLPFTITNPAENAIQIGLIGTPIAPTPANVSFVQPLLINDLDRDISGIFIANTSGTTVFQTSASTTIQYDTATTGTAAGFEFFQNLAGNLTLNNGMVINDSGGAGLRITNDLDVFPNDLPGEFRWLGGAGIGSLTINRAGANQGAGGAALIIGADPPAGAPNNSVAGSGYESDVTFSVPVTVNNSAGTSILVSQNTGDVSFTNGAAVNATTAATPSQVSLFDNLGNIFFSTLSVDNFVATDIDFLDDNEPTAAELAAQFAALDMRRNNGRITINEVDIDVIATGIFGYNNQQININGGSVSTVFATAVEIFMADSAIDDNPLGFNLTQLGLELDNVDTVQAPDHGVHLANVKGQATFLSGDFIQAGTGALLGPTEQEAGIYVDNSAVRLREIALSPNINDRRIFSNRRSFALEVFNSEFTQNTKGILAIAIDDLEVDESDFTQNFEEAIDLLNVVSAEITESEFTNNQAIPDPATFGAVQAATIRSRMTLALNSDNSSIENTPTFYDLVVGARTPDFVDPTANDDQNTFDEQDSQFSILMINNAIDNTIGILDTGTSGSEFGFIVNNNAFENDSDIFFQGFVQYRDDAGGNSRVNMNVAMNSMESDDDNLVGTLNATAQGAISFIHNSTDTNDDDDIVFTAIDNFLNLEEQDSIGYMFIDEGDGDAFILVDDTDNDGLTELNDPINDPLVADITVANGPVFFFDLETDADVSIQNLEIQVLEDSDNITGTNTATVIEDQRVFFFDNVSGIADIDIGGNTIFIDDSGSFIDPFTGNLFLVNDILVTEFDAASGEITLNSSANNTVQINPSGAFLTNPNLLFDAPIGADITGQLQFNGLFVP